MERHLDIGIPVRGERFPGLLVQRAQRGRGAGNQSNDVGAIQPEQVAGHYRVTRISGFELQALVASSELGERAGVASDGDNRWAFRQECLGHTSPKSATGANDHPTLVSKLVHPYPPLVDKGRYRVKAGSTR